MNAPLAIPTHPTLASMVWRALSGLTVVRRLREVAEARRALVRTGRDTDTDTSLTQAHLEILK
jgi:hypothetical protein